MQWAAAGVGDGGFGHWHLSRIRRPYRTGGFQGIPTRHCVPGFNDPSRWDESGTGLRRSVPLGRRAGPGLDDPSRWDKEREMCIQIRARATG